MSTVLLAMLVIAIGLPLIALLYGCTHPRSKE